MAGFELGTDLRGEEGDREGGGTRGKEGRSSTESRHQIMRSVTPNNGRKWDKQEKKLTTLSNILQSTLYQEEEETTKEGVATRLAPKV